MPAGRPPKSKLDKLMSGDPGKRIPPSEMAAFERGEHPLQAQAASPSQSLTLTPPKTLTKGAVPIWKEVVGGHLAGTYAITDKSQLIVFCEARATFDMATQMIQSEGYLSTGATGQTVVSPWVTIQKDAAARIDKIGTTLFLTPTARAAMRDQATFQATAKAAEVVAFKGLIGGRA